MMILLKKFIYFILIIDLACIANSQNKCQIPEGCRLEHVYEEYGEEFTEKGFDKTPSIMCDVN
jgi:hypothetical protein